MFGCGFIIPGDINLPTGGYGYDRRVLALLPASGVDAQHVVLPDTYPFPSQTDLDASLKVMAALPSDMVLLIDGLALGAMPEQVVRQIRQPIVALCHHPLGLESGLASDQSAALKASERAALALARAVVVTSAITKAILVEDFNVIADRITVAEPGTDPATRARGTSGANGAAPLQLLAVGSIVPRKGYDVLLNALAGLKSRAWALTIAGADDRAPETTALVRRMIADHGFELKCRMLGPVDASGLDRLYDEADLFVMPSLYEGYGMVIGEAMARGLPIVCTTGGAAAETAPDAAAIKVPPGDVDAFRAALQRVLEDPALRTRMAEASWRAGKGLPRWETTAGLIADVIKRVQR